MIQFWLDFIAFSADIWKCWYWHFWYFRRSFNFPIWDFSFH